MFRFFHSIASGLVWYINLYRGARWYKKTFVGIVSFIIFFILYLGAVDVNLFWLFGKSPGISSIWSPKTYTASQIYSADGELIGEFYNENRVPVEYGEVAPIFWKALIDTEDERFYSHIGVDPEGILGAMKDAALGRSRGASTITQQLAKNLFKVRSQYSTGLLGKVPGLSIIIQKSKEWIIALKFELLLPLKHNGSRASAKEEILTMYANTVDFGNNSFGIKTASRTYFDKHPKDLTADEAALLVGVLKGTSLYNPKTKPENALKRRNVVLSNMLKHGDLSPEEYEEYSSRGLDLNFKEERNSRGNAMYFRDAVAKELEEWCEMNGYDIYTAGLKIYTTIDMTMQRHAEKAVEKEMRSIQQNFLADWSGEAPWAKQDRMLVDKIMKRQPYYSYLVNKYGADSDSIDYYLYHHKRSRRLFTYDGNHVMHRELTVADSVRHMLRIMRCSMVAMDPSNGHVKAYVGGVDHSFWQFDAAQAVHQAGSTFKLFVYTEAMNQGFTPCDRRRDEPFTKTVWDNSKRQNVAWTPRNAGGEYTGDSLYLKTAFARSVNTIAAKLGDQVGISNILETANRMGVKSPISAIPAVALGACDVTLLEMVNAYSTVANYGRRQMPILVTRIKDLNGNTLEDFEIEGERAIPERTAYLMQKMLKGGLTEQGGTSQRLNEYIGSYQDTDFGGKTGTTNNNSDAWYMCVTPRLVVGAWVGGEYRSIHFRSGRLGQGSRTALPIVGSFLRSVMADRKHFQHLHARFRRPDIPESIWDCSGVIEEEPDSMFLPDSIFISEEYPEDEEHYWLDDEDPQATEQEETLPNEEEPDGYEIY